MLGGSIYVYVRLVYFGGDMGVGLGGQNQGCFFYDIFKGYCQASFYYKKNKKTILKIKASGRMQCKRGGGIVSSGADHNRAGGGILCTAGAVYV